MPLLELHSLLFIFVIAALSPFISEWLPKVRVSIVVIEIALGLIIGPQLLCWAESGPTIQTLSNFGLAFLFFLAGFEIDFKAIRGRPLIMAVVIWILSLCVCLAAGYGMQWSNLVDSGLIVGAALTTTALGTIMPILRDAKELPTRFGAYTVASGAMGEFGPIILIALVLSGGEGEHGGSIILMVVFTLIILASSFAAMYYRPPHLVTMMQTKMHTSAQLPVRIAVLVLATLVMLARNMGLDTILGALAAGIVVSFASPGHFGKELSHKLEAIAFGFFAPIFFVSTGLRYDLNALLSSKTALLQLPLFLILFLVVRGLPAMFILKDLDFRSRIAMGLFNATQLPLVVAICEIGVRSGNLKSETAASLVGAGMVSVLLFPMIALSIRRSQTVEKPG